MKKHLLGMSADISLRKWSLWCLRQGHSLLPTPTQFADLPFLWTGCCQDHRCPLPRLPPSWAELAKRWGLSPAQPLLGQRVCWGGHCWGHEARPPSLCGLLPGKANQGRLELPLRPPHDQEELTVHAASPAGNVEHPSLHSFKTSDFSKKCNCSFFVDLRHF